MLPCVGRVHPLLAFISFALLTQGENCPATCKCPDPHTVDCSGRGLTRLPDEIPLDVRRLLLSNNWIPRIPSDFLVLYSDLVYLDLRNNSLSHIEPGTLSPSSRLVFLDLGSNNLTKIPKGTFGESRSLIKLRLGNNPHLSMVNEDAFRGLTSLRELELERNALSSLQVGALSQLPSLRVVRLEGNPWVCNCNFANLFAWLVENSHKLPNGKFLRFCETINIIICAINDIYCYISSQGFGIYRNSIKTGNPSWGLNLFPQLIWRKFQNNDTKSRAIFQPGKAFCHVPMGTACFLYSQPFSYLAFHSTWGCALSTSYFRQSCQATSFPLQVCMCISQLYTCWLYSRNLFCWKSVLFFFLLDKLHNRGW